MSDYTPLTPVEVERKMAEAVGYIKKGTGVVKSAREAARKAKRDYKLALAKHRQNDEGSRVDREDRALIATAELWEAMDTAEVAAEYAGDKKEDLRGELMALQTDAKLVLQAYNVSNKTDY